MSRYENKRLYIDVEEWGGTNRYIKLQADMFPMIWEKYDLSAMEERIFLYICMQYDNAHESHLEPIKLSYADLARKVNCSKNGVINALDNLIYWELIEVKGEQKGRAKKQYVPNVDKIHKELKEFLNLA